MSVFVANESGATVDEQRLVVLAQHVLAEMGVSPLAELSILLVDTGHMERLHVQWMGEPGATDVLAFSQDELDDRPLDDNDEVPPTLLGDVVLCPVVAAKQAETLGHSTAAELDTLCAHGILHLLGYDHAEPEEEQLMFREQSRLLESWRVVRSGNA